MSTATAAVEEGFAEDTDDLSGDDHFPEQGDDEDYFDQEEEEEDWQLMPRALPVGNDLTRDPPRDAPPTSGEEYLRWVRWEAKKCPKIVVASDEAVEKHQIRELAKRSQQTNRTENEKKEEKQHDDESRQPRKKQKKNKRAHYAGEQVGGLADFILPAPMPKCPPALKPSLEWESNFLTSFKEFRKQLEQQQQHHQQQKKVGDRLPKSKDSQRWKTFCLSNTSNLTPEVLAALDDVRVTTLLDYFSQWIKEERTSQLTKFEPEPIGTSRTSDITHTSSFPPSGVGHSILTDSESPGAKWLYALLAKLETPIAAESASTLRDILRHCAEIRATQIVSVDDGRLPFLNILVTILSHFFGQDES